MKIAIGFDKKIYGTVALGTDGGFVYEGDQPFLRKVVTFWKTHGFDGEQLLRAMADRLHGRTWAREVPADWHIPEDGRW
jgi:hypothetical protein